MAGVSYIQIVDFVSNLIDKFTDTDTDLPIYEEHLSKLRNRLSVSGYTYLTISDGTNLEIIKVQSANGYLSVVRGLEQTTPHTFPKGSVVKWAMTSSAVRDIVCQMDCCPDE